MKYLTSEEVTKAKKNISEIKPYKTTKEIIFSNIFTFFNAMNLFLAAFIATTLRFENMLFLGVITINTAIGIFQEVRSKNALEKLSLLGRSKYRVNRDNEIINIDSEEIVLGEYLHLNLGDQVPVDAEIIEGSIEVDESLLTGESDNIFKTINDKVMSGSNVVSGSCLVRAIAVGEDSYINKLAKSTKEFKKYPSKLRDYMDKILKVISILLVPVAIMLYMRGASLGRGYVEIVLRSAGALVGMIPEGLILLVSVSLAVAAMKLAKKKVLVQELYCVETLARVDVLCFDKTGTITTGNMNVVEIDDEVAEKLSSYLAYFDDENATSRALKNHLTCKKQWDVEELGAFSSKNKYSFIKLKNGGTYFFGAYEFLGFASEMDEYYENLKKEGYRILSLAYTEDSTNIPTNMKLVGHVVLSDEIKENTKETFKYFESQGVEVKIISGDNHIAVYGVAKKAGFKEDAKAIDMTKVTEEDFEKTVLENDIFGRVTPEQKQKMVAVLQKAGKTVAMSGDGVNDVLALKKADISFAMNGATSAAKSVSNIVFLTDDFGVFYDILMEGRRVINNIQKVASLFLTKTFFSIVFSILSVIFALEFAFIPIQFTIISAITIGIPSFFLTFEANKEKVSNNFMKDILTNAAIGGGILVATVLLTSFAITDSSQAKFICFLLALINGLCMVAKVSLPLNKYKLALLSMLSIAAIIGVGVNIFILKNHFAPLVFSQVIYIIILGLVISTVHFFTRRKNK
ncbi:HAD-IC family P-type ATPase [Gemella haemolysans]|uniref:E1-E2 ATPase n=1 Tax=Gemella haemolysans ATCC 10379 TaxID=546270 RepID=C5NVI8_9BACL|nr:HAD-IC family P-type ATPase [Gemella haemolysans]EER68624.1 E1-E2 ATPase [Gemella haemolysans ATCC 10379]KAA8708315.1 HAD-IC family P-type ATPase [Gemella haemolysans]UBH82387.1 HAD-IC family P-type ATPase [Gemella haemolysans]VEI39375.1 Probable cation-transporting ATPase F [Gemella haemolysans]